MEKSTAEQIVKAKYPDAVPYLSQWDNCTYMILRQPISKLQKPLGEGFTEDAAWIDAAARIGGDKGEGQ